MRTVFASLVFAWAAAAQVQQQSSSPQAPPAVEQPASLTQAPATLAAPPAPPIAVIPAPEAPVVEVMVPPLAPPDPDSPYASPRDAARHWFQVTLANLAEQRDTRAAMRGFAQAFLLDRSYAAAAFNLGVIAAIEEKWDDAAAALAEASRLDPRGFGVKAKGPLERVRLLAALERSAEGKLKRRYDEALHGILPLLPGMSPSDAMKSLALVGRIDPQRWEAPALLAGLTGDGVGYDVSAPFLRIALKNAADPAIKARLETALAAAEREVSYASARLTAESAAEAGKYADAADAYESAWRTVPARFVNGMEAVSARLLTDDTARASAALLRMRDGGDAQFGSLAAAMLKELALVEPGARASSGEDREFYRDRGSSRPPRIADLIPAVDRNALEVYGRPLPRLATDREAVVLIASLAADAGAAPATALPPLDSPRIAGDRPWTELQSAMPAGTPAAQPARPLEAADLGHNARIRRVISVTSEPPGAKVFYADRTDAICETPCSVQVAEGRHSLRVSLAGYEDQQQTIATAGSDREFGATLVSLRGSVLVLTPAAAQIAINGTAVPAQAPAALSLVPGLYRIAADWGNGPRERLLNVKPGAKLRLDWPQEIK